MTASKYFYLEHILLVIIRSRYAPIIVTPHLPQVGDGWDLQESFDKFPIPGDNFMLQIPTFCIGIPKTMKILGQMPQPWRQKPQPWRQKPQPWRQNMLTNCYKSPPIAQPGVGGD